MKIKYRKALVVAGLFAAIAVWIGTSTNPKPPSFNKALMTSGLQFQEMPQVLKWHVQEFGFFNADRIVSVVFSLSIKDEKIGLSCSKELKLSNNSDLKLENLGIDYTKPICWKIVKTDDALHHFVLQGDQLFYVALH